MFALSGLLACGGRPTHFAADFQQRALRQHKIIAVMPFTIEYEEPGGIYGGMSLADYELARIKERDADSYVLQGMLAHKLAKQSKSLTVSIQDTGTTNRLLRGLHLTYEKLHRLPRPEVARLLGADAVVSTVTGNRNLMTLGLAWAMSIVVAGGGRGIWAPVNEVRSLMMVHDGRTGDLLSEYYYVGQGSTLSFFRGLARKQVRQMAGDFPYQTRYLKHRLPKARPLPIIWEEEQPQQEQPAEEVY